jgi:hypothetical protein
MTWVGAVELEAITMGLEEVAAADGAAPEDLVTSDPFL